MLYRLVTRLLQGERSVISVKPIVGTSVYVLWFTRKFVVNSHRPNVHLAIRFAFTFKLYCPPHLLLWYYRSPVKPRRYVLLRPQDRTVRFFLRTFGDGTMLYVVTIRSGYSSRIFDIISVPIPEPVPPPNEWVSWNPWRQSQPSASFLRIFVIFSVPFNMRKLMIKTFVEPHPNRWSDEVRLEDFILPRRNEYWTKLLFW